MNAPPHAEEPQQHSIPENHRSGNLQPPHSPETKTTHPHPAPTARSRQEHGINNDPPSPHNPPSRYNAPVARIILFDIDQTLLYSGGAGSLAMRKAFHQLHGIDDAFGQIEFSGLTDWAILKRGMQQHGLLNSDQPFSGHLSRFQQAYFPLVQPMLREVEGGHLKPGVIELLDALAERPDISLGLATGNFREAAFIKLRHFGLDGYLSDGGFGDDAEDRGEVVGIAIQRIANGATPGPTDVWVIGDTPRDISAARANNARSLGVATGSTTTEELRDAGATIALTDLSDTDAVMSVLLE